MVINKLVLRHPVGL